MATKASNVYYVVIKRYIAIYKNKRNKELISEIYKTLNATQ